MSRSLDTTTPRIERARDVLRTEGREAADQLLIEALEHGVATGDGRLASTAWDTWIDDEATPPLRAWELRARAADLLGLDPTLAWTQAIQQHGNEGELSGLARCAVSAARAVPEAFADNLEAAYDVEAPDPGWPTYASAMDAVFSGRWSDAETPAAAALEWARAQGDRHLEADALGTLSSCLAYRGETAESLSLLLDSMRIADRLGDVTLARRARFNLPEAYTDNLEAERAMGAARDASAWARGMHRPAGELLEFRLTEAHYAAIHGDAPAARAALSAAMEIAHGFEQIPDDAYVPAQLGAAMVQILTTAPNESKQWMEEAVARAEAWGFDSYTASAHQLRALHSLFRLDADGALAAAERVLDLAADEPVTALESEVTALIAHRLVRGAEPTDLAPRPLAAGPLGSLLGQTAAALRNNTTDEIHRLARRWELAGRLPNALALRLIGATNNEVVQLELQATELQLEGVAELARRLRGSNDDTRADARAWWVGDDVHSRAALARCTTELTLPAGTCALLEPGVLATIEQGAVLSWLGHDSDLPVFCGTAAGPASILGAADVLANEPTSWGRTLRAVTDARVVVYDGPALHETIEANPLVGHTLGRLAANEAQAERELSHELATLSAELRLARCLLRLVEILGRPTLHGERLIDAPFTNAELAAMIGSQRARVNRFLSGLRADGTLGEFRRRVVIVDSAALRCAAGLDGAPL